MQGQPFKPNKININSQTNPTFPRNYLARLSPSDINNARGFYYLITRHTKRPLHGTQNPVQPDKTSTIILRSNGQ